MCFTGVLGDMLVAVVFSLLVPTNLIEESLFFVNSAGRSVSMGQDEVNFDSHKFVLITFVYKSYPH